MKGVLVNFAVVCILLCNDTAVEAERNGLQSIALAIAKGKEILDRGVKLQSQRQDSVDFFGTKVDTSISTKQGFGDAVNEGATDSFEDDLERKKRAVDVFEYLRSQGLFTNSASGTNVNIVKINSVSNVNNYGQTPAEATTVASRKRRSMKYVAADETMSVMASEDEMKPNGSFKGDSMGEIHEAHMKKMMLGDGDKKKNKRLVPVLYKSWDEKVTGFRSESRMKPGGAMKTHTISETDDMSSRGVVVGAKSADELDDEVPPRYERSIEEVRSKRSPQEIDEDASSTERPPCGGRGKGGPGGPGGRGGKRGGGRGRGPPPPPEEDDEEDTDDERAKREIKQSSQNNVEASTSNRPKSNSDSKSKSQTTTDSSSESESDSDSNESSNSESDSDSGSDSGSDSDESDSNSTSSGRSTTPPPAAVVRSKRSPCWGRRQQVTTTTVATARMKREVPTSVEELDEEQQKVHSWFHTVVETIVESAKRVSAAVRRVFGRDGEANPDAESNPNAETLE